MRPCAGEGQRWLARGQVLPHRGTIAARHAAQGVGLVGGGAAGAIARHRHGRGPVQLLRLLMRRWERLLGCGGCGEGVAGRRGRRGAKAGSASQGGGAGAIGARRGRRILCIAEVQAAEQVQR
jgi:hypothetical protein